MPTSDTACLGRQKDHLTHKIILKMLDVHTQHQPSQKYPSLSASVSVLLGTEDVIDV